MTSGLHLNELPLVFAAGGAVDPLVGDIGFCLIVSGLLCVVFNRLTVVHDLGVPQRARIAAARARP